MTIAVVRRTMPHGHLLDGTAVVVEALALTLAVDHRMARHVYFPDGSTAAT